MMKLVEESSGVGPLMRNGEVLREVGYRISRYQGMAEGSGLPIPGLFRIEGSIENSADLVGVALSLRLEDGRVLAVTIVDIDGRVLSEGHGPMRCLCC